MRAENEEAYKTHDLDERVALAKESEAEMESLLSSYRPYFAHTAMKYAMHSEAWQKDELFSVAQMGFYEAAKGFDRAKGHFFPFAKMVMRNRIIDHMRKNSGRDGNLTLDHEHSVDGTPLSSLIGKASVERHDQDMRQKKIAEELTQFRKELASWNISMESLVKESPKHDSLRQAYKGLVLAIMESQPILDTILKKHYLPVKEISKLTGLPQKKIERARTFILAAILIKLGDYDFLSDYVEGWGGF